MDFTLKNPNIITKFMFVGEPGTKVQLCSGFGRNPVNEWVLTENILITNPFEGDKSELPLCCVFRDLLRIISDKSITIGIAGKRATLEELVFYDRRAHGRTNTKGETVIVEGAGNVYAVKN